MISDESTPRMWLETATVWRFLSLLFTSPTSASLRELQSLIDELPATMKEDARKLMDLSLESWELEFHRVLGPGRLPATESSFEENALAGRGPFLADISGFYEAFAYRPSVINSEVPDHISVELGFLSYLAVKIAFAEFEGRSEESSTTQNAYQRFLADHLLYWADSFRQTLLQAASRFYSVGAAWICQAASSTSAQKPPPEARTQRPNDPVDALGFEGPEEPMTCPKSPGKSV